MSAMEWMSRSLGSLNLEFGWRQERKSAALAALKRRSENPLGFLWIQLALLSRCVSFVLGWIGAHGAVPADPCQYRICFVCACDCKSQNLSASHAKTLSVDGFSEFVLFFAS